jgi:hypothetical protein
MPDASAQCGNANDLKHYEDTESGKLAGARLCQRGQTKPDEGDHVCDGPIDQESPDSTTEATDRPITRFGQSPSFSGVSGLARTR